MIESLGFAKRSLRGLLQRPQTTGGSAGWGHYERFAAHTMQNHPHLFHLSLPDMASGVQKLSKAGHI